MIMRRAPFSILGAMDARFLIAIVAFCTLLFSGTRAFAYTPPANEGPITDPAGKLSADDKQALDQKLRDYKDRTKNEVTYFIAPSLNGEDISDVSFATFNAWQLGSKADDNGVLVVMAPNERKIRIEVGKGREGDLTDLQSSQIIQQIIGPRLKVNDFRGAIDQSADAIVSALGDNASGKKTPAAGDQASLGSVIFFVILILLVIFIARAINRRGGGGGGGPGGGPGFFWFGGGGGGSGGGGFGGGGFGGGGGGGGSWGGGGGSSGGGGASGSY
jgi:uncharacterized protein